MRSILFLSAFAAFSARAKVPILQGLAFVDLTVAESTVTINLPTPSALGDECRVQLRSNQSFGFSREFTALEGKIIVEEGGFPDYSPLKGEVKGNSLTYRFKAASAYMSLVRVRNRDGRPLKKAVSEAFSKFTSPSPPQVQIILIREGCQ